MSSFFAGAAVLLLLLVSSVQAVAYRPQHQSMRFGGVEKIKLGFSGCDACCNLVKMPKGLEEKKMLNKKGKECGLLERAGSGLKNLVGADGACTETVVKVKPVVKGYAEDEGFYYYMGVRGSALLGACHNPSYRSARCGGACTATDMHAKLAQWKTCSGGLTGMKCETGGADGGPWNFGTALPNDMVLARAKCRKWCIKVEVPKHKTSFFTWDQQKGEEGRPLLGEKACGLPAGCGDHEATCALRCPFKFSPQNPWTGRVINYEKYTSTYKKAHADAAAPPMAQPAATPKAAVPTTAPPTEGPVVASNGGNTGGNPNPGK